MISPVVVGLFWKLIYNPNFGFFNFVLGAGNPASGIDMLASRFAGKPMPGLALIAVLLNDKERWQDACELFEYGFAALWKEKIQRLSLPGPERVDQGGSGG